MVAAELSGIWVLPSPSILKPITHDEFWQDIVWIAFITSLCFIFTIHVHFIYSTIKVSKYYFVFIPFIFIFHIILQAFKDTVPTITWRDINTKNSAISGSNLKEHKPPFWISVDLSDTLKSQMKHGKKSPRQKKIELNQFFLIRCIWSWMIWVSVKILMTLFWFLQNTSARSRFEETLMSPTWSYIML